MKCVGDELVCSGRHVVVVGDFNVPHKDKDVYRNWNIRDLYSPGIKGYGVVCMMQLHDFSDHTMKNFSFFCVVV